MQFRNRLLALPAIALAFNASVRPVAAQLLAHGTNPVVSPDGQTVIYKSETPGAPGVYRIGIDGKASRKIADIDPAIGRPVWNTDGSKLLWAHNAGDALHVFATDADGKGNQLLGEVSVSDVKGITVSSDGSHIVFGSGPWTSTQLYSSALNAKPTKLTIGNDAYWCQAVSRDGKQIAVGKRVAGSGIQVWVMNMDGSSARQVTHFAKGDPQCPAWSADGKKLAVQSSVPLGSDTTKHVGTISIVDVATGAATVVGQHDKPYSDEVPSWFPDGKRLAFQSDRSGAWQVWVMNIDGSGAHQLTGHGS